MSTKVVQDIIIRKICLDFELDISMICFIKSQAEIEYCSYNDKYNNKLIMMMIIFSKKR